MQNWLWFVLIGLVAFAGFDYGRRFEREPQLAVDLAAYRDRDRLRDELAKERAARGRAIAAAVANIATQRDRERAEAQATNLGACPVDPAIDGVRRQRDAEANEAIENAYRADASRVRAGRDRSVSVNPG